ncbi:MAG: nuclear transport factor 2 family protein [Candidatus Thiodiazotropha sp.]
MDPDRIQHAVIQWECQQHLHKVSLLTDRQDWKGLAMCYAEDGVLTRPSDPKNPIVGRDAILASFRARPPRITAHLLGNSVFEIAEPTLVKVVSRVWLVSAPKGEADGAAIADSPLLAGTFVDELVHDGDRWLISCRDGSVEVKFGQ